MGAPDASEGIVLDAAQLSSEALRGLVEEFVTRDGTDYGAVEASVETKVSQVCTQLARGEAQIVFDPASETTSIVPVQPGGS